MRPKERRDSGQSDLFQARLDQIVDTSHPLAKRAAAIEPGFLCSTQSIPGGGNPAAAADAPESTALFVDEPRPMICQTA